MATNPIFGLTFWGYFMVKIDIKPISVNEAWKGRRFKTDKYKSFRKRVLLHLRPMKLPEEGKLEIHLKYGFTTAGADIDNPTKMILDILSEKFRFNDNRIYRLIIDKDVVGKGNEYFSYSIKVME